MEQYFVKIRSVEKVTHDVVKIVQRNPKDQKTIVKFRGKCRKDYQRTISKHQLRKLMNQLYKRWLQNHKTVIALNKGGTNGNEYFTNYWSGATDHILSGNKDSQANAQRTD